MIALQSQVIETQQSKSINQAKENYAGFIRFINAIQAQIAYERGKIQSFNSSSSLRSNQQVALVRKHEIILRLINELDSLLICIEEGNKLQTEFERMKNKYSELILNFVQYTEERISVQKDKLLIRMSGISKLTIDDICEQNMIPRHTTSQEIIYMIQSCSLKLVSDFRLPKTDLFDPLFNYLSGLNNEIDPIVVFNTLQFLEILCSQNLGSSKSICKDELQYLIHKLLMIIPHAFSHARVLWIESFYDIIPVFITQLFQTLNALLHSLQLLGSEYSSLYATNHHIHHENTDNNVDSNNYLDNSNKLYCWGEKYSFELLLEDVIIWLKVLKVAKLHLLTGSSNVSMEIVQIINKIFKFHDENLISCSLISEFEKHLQSFSESFLNIKIIASPKKDCNEDKSCIYIKEDIITISKNILNSISELLVIGCPIVINILQTVDKLINIKTVEYRNDVKSGCIPKLPTIPIFGSSEHTLLLAGLDLAAISCGKYSVRLGPQGSPIAVSIFEQNFLKAADAEISIGMQLANISFSNGLWEMAAFDILQYGYQIVAHRSNSLLLSSSWLRCLTACTLCCLENDPPSNDDISLAIQHYIALNRPKLELSKDSTRRSSVDNTKIKFLQLKTKDPLFLVPIATNFAKKSRIIYHLSSTVLRMLAVTASLKHVLGIAHSGLLLSRLLMRDLFLKRLEIEELFDSLLLPQLQPLLNEVAAKHQVDEDDDESHNNLDLSSQIIDVTMSTVLSTDSIDIGGFGSVSTVRNSVYPQENEWPNSHIGGLTIQASMDTTATSNSRVSSKTMPPSSDEYWKQWYEKNFNKAFYREISKANPNHQSSVKKLNFIDVMQFIGESHLQSTEVIEQLLLLISHISVKSSLIRHTMIESGFSLIIQRIIDSQSNNLYMVALAEVCLDTINA